MRKHLLTILFLCGWLLAGTTIALAAGVVGDGSQPVAPRPRLKAK